MFVLGQVTGIVLHLAQAFPGVQIPCLCNPKNFWASPHPVSPTSGQCSISPSWQHFCMPMLRSAQALPSVVIVINPCSGELSESNSPLKSQCSPQKLVLILTPHGIPACVHFSKFTNTADFGCSYRNVALMISQSQQLSPCYSFSFSFSHFPSFALKSVCARRQLRGTRALPS